MEVPSTIINITGSDDGYLTKLLGKKVFDYPKPRKLLEYLIKIATNKNDIILDFFAGSGTTGEVSYNLGRKFVLIQKNEYIKNQNIKNIPDIIVERFKKRDIPLTVIF